MNRNAPCEPPSEEMLRYLGYGDQSLGEELRSAIESVRGACCAQVAGAWCYRVFPCQARNDHLVLEDAALELSLASLGEAWEPAIAVGLMACTLGASFDRHGARLAVDAGLEGLLWDAAGSAAVEACADGCEAALAQRAQEKGLACGQRVSPGYGELPLVLSASLVAVLGADRLIGVHSTAEGVLLPRKSVTALVPVFARETQARRARRSCDDCVAAAGCSYRRQGLRCYRMEETPS